MYEPKATILRCVRAAKEAGFSCDGEIPTFYNKTKRISFSVDTGRESKTWSFRPKSKIVARKATEILSWINKNKD